MAVKNFVFIAIILFSTLISYAQNSETSIKDAHNEISENELIDIKVDIVAKDNYYLVKLDKSLFYYYVISNEPIPELDDQDLFINLVDSDNPGWPIVEAGYIDTRYGINEFELDLKGKNFYLLGTNGINYSEVNEFDFNPNTSISTTNSE